MTLPLGLAATLGILLLFTAAGSTTALALCPARRGFRLELGAWGFAVGLAIIAISVPLALATTLRPGWLPALLVALLAAGLGWAKRLPATGSEAETPMRLPRTALLWLVPLLAGVAIYGLRALSEPMWSNDFVSDWGLKGKMVFAEGRVPPRLFSDVELAFSNPEYPLGIPFLYAGVAFLYRQWDDHAMALLFPAMQVATLAVVAGWLRRRGATPAASLAAAALLALFDPLYAAYITGYADIPLSFFVLLLATSLADALDRTDPGALRRLALAAVLCCGTKNEGLYFVVAAMGIGVVTLRRRRLPVAPLIAALLVPAALVIVVPRLAWETPPLGAYDFGYLRPALWGALASRLVLTLRLIGKELLWPGTPALLLVLAGLFIAGRRTPWADRVLVLALIGEFAYLTLPVFAVYPGAPDLGPEWIVTTSLGRTSAALAPLVAVGLAGRLGLAPNPSRPA